MKSKKVSHTSTTSHLANAKAPTRFLKCWSTITRSSPLKPSKSHIECTVNKHQVITVGQLLNLWWPEASQEVKWFSITQNYTVIAEFSVFFLNPLISLITALGSWSKTSTTPESEHLFNDTNICAFFTCTVFCLSFQPSMNILPCCLVQPSTTGPSFLERLAFHHQLFVIYKRHKQSTPKSCFQEVQSPS